VAVDFMGIRLSNVAVTVAESGSAPRTILDIAALDIPPHSLTVIAGPSGSGKSTLLNVIAGVTPASSGTVTAHGETVSSYTEAARDNWRRMKTGLIFQDFNLISELSPLDNILLPASFGRRPGGIGEKARELMARFGIPHDRKRLGLMSRGEQQRVAVARALIFDPEIILADEATASLDVENGRFVIDALAEEAAKGRTVIAASHDPELIARAHQVIRLDHGRPIQESAT
jgi:putative ABC transport system ATP-binding protein